MIKRLSIILILLACFWSNLGAQTSVEEYYQFDSIYKTTLGYYNRGLYHKAALCPESLAENRYVNATTNYFFARVFSLSNEFDKTLEYIEKAVELGVTKSQIEKMYDLDGFRESNLNIVYEMNYDKWHQEYLLSQENVQLDSVYIKEIRKIRKDYSNKLKLRKIEGDEIIWVEDSTNYYLTTKKLDSLSFHAIVDLTLEKGFPTTKTIGKDYYWYSRILRYNMPVEYDENCDDWKKIKKSIHAEMKKGTVYPFYYAAIEDNLKVSRKQPQIYGTIPVVYSGNKDVSDVLQFENPEELNIRRRVIGLCSIQLELWSQARELPKSLKGVQFK